MHTIFTNVNCINTSFIVSLSNEMWKNQKLNILPYHKSVYYLTNLSTTVVIYHFTANCVKGVK